MSGPTLSSFLFVIGRVVGTKLLGKFNAILYTVLGVATDDAATDAESSADNPCFGDLGSYGVPEPPAAGQWCDGFNMRMGDGLIPIGFRDLRISKRVSPAVGALGLAHYGGGYLDFSWSRDRLGTVVSLSAPHLDGNDAVDSAHYLSMDPADANNAVMLVHRQGHGLLMGKDGSVTIKSVSGNNTIVVNDADGVVLGGKMNFFGGIVAGTSTLAQPVALSPEVVALFNALLTALATAFSTPTPSPGAPLNAAWASAVVAALQALLTNLQNQGTATTLKASPT